MKTVYYYDGEGKFSNVEVSDDGNVLSVVELVDTNVSGYYANKKLPITKYKTRYGETIWIASRNKFEAKCLINNHLDLDIHIQTSYPTHVYSEHSNSIHDDLLNRLVHKTKSKFRFSLQVRDCFGGVEVLASI